MLILALDSTAVTASAALCRDESTLAAFHVKNGNTHSETLLPMVKSILCAADLSVDDVDLFACSIGPGSFTGVRIGAATVKGLAFGKSKTVIGVSTLEALAENFSGLDGLICPVMNARRNQVYQAFFNAHDGKIERVTADRAISVEELETELAAYNRPFYLCGDGADLVRGALKTCVPRTSPTLLTDQNAVSVAAVAYRAYLAGVRTTDADLSPVYLRLPQAERERLKKISEHANV